MHPTDLELEAWLDEALAPEEMARLEEQVRTVPALRARLSTILGRRDAGVHSLGTIWRRQRLTCATRSELGSYLLGVLDEGHRRYLDFHLQTIGCRYCLANLADLRNEQAERPDAARNRRQRYFQSSAGYLRST